MREPWSGEIRVTCLQLFGLYITVDGVTGGRGYTEAVIKHQTVKNLNVVLLLLAYLDEWGVPVVYKNLLLYSGAGNRLNECQGSFGHGNV